jgi:hypothetical protein
VAALVILAILATPLLLWFGSGKDDPAGFEQNPTKGSQQVERRPLEPNLYGVVAGVNDYSRTRNFEGLHDLHASVRGATAVHGAFMEMKGRFYRDVQLTLLRDAQVTRAAILSQLHGLAEKARAEDRLLLYLNGHGEVGGGGSTSRFKFICSDSDQRLEDQKLTSTDIVSVLRKLPCRCIILLDADYCGELVHEPGLDPQRHVVLAACKQNELALAPNPTIVAKYPILSEVQHTLFTLALLDALENRRRSDSIDTTGSSISNVPVSSLTHLTGYEQASWNS